MTSKTLLAAAIAAAFLFPVSAVVAAGAGSGPKATLFAKFDTNKNGVIDGEEVTAVRAAFAAEPKGQFATYDKNHDGKLDDAEIAGIKPPGAGGKKGEKKAGGAKKKSDADKAETK